MKSLSSFIKKSGRLFDIWSVPHFLFGIVVAMVAIVFSLPFSETLAALLLIAFLWECFEMWLRISEYFWNMLTDVLLPVLAYLIVFPVIEQTGIDHEHRVALLVISLLVYISTNAFAWRARFSGDQDFYN